MVDFRLGPNDELLSAESGIDSCPNLERCSGSTPCTLELSSIQPKDARRGSRDPLILLVTEAPDKESSEGSAYSGSISTRVISIFKDEKYGIQLNCHENDSFEEFLIDNRIYSTSAIKCYVSDCNSTQIGNYVVDSCHERYLSQQIKSMDSLELIIPMGRVATESILEIGSSDNQISNIIGMRNRGILTKPKWGNPEVVVFPHPSGLNRLSNPPILDDGDELWIRKYKLRFRDALSYVRQFMDQHGYDVADSRPDIWDQPSGFSDYA